MANQLLFVAYVVALNIFLNFGGNALVLFMLFDARFCILVFQNSIRA